MKSSQSLNILIDNTGAENLGAWLMAESVMKALSDRSNERFKFVFNRSAFGRRKKNGVLFTTPGIGNNTAWLQEDKLFEARSALHMISKIIRRKSVQFNYDKIGLVYRQEIQHIIDVGGYWLGSPWENSAQRLRDKTLQYEQVIRKGGKVILMPQAYGTFDSLIPQHQALFNAATIVYARDEKSFDNLKPVCDEAKIKYHPDFTYNIECSKGQESGDILLIPNIKLMEKGGMTFSALVEFYVSIHKLSQKSYPSKKIVLLNHAGSKDHSLCVEISSATNSELKCPSTPFEAKNIISRAFLCISGRYHGIINSLYTDTPVVGTSWSHKYEVLFNEYKIPEMLISPDIEGTKSLQKLLETDSFEEKVVSIKKRNQQLRARYPSIWDNILPLLLDE